MKKQSGIDTPITAYLPHCHGKIDVSFPFKHVTNSREVTSCMLEMTIKCAIPERSSITEKILVVVEPPMKGPTRHGTTSRIGTRSRLTLRDPLWDVISLLYKSSCLRGLRELQRIFLAEQLNVIKNRCTSRPLPFRHRVRVIGASNHHLSSEASSSSCRSRESGSRRSNSRAARNRINRNMTEASSRLKD